ncbi:O-antigen polymerase [Rhodanobacter sp. Root179]|uniref:O-antigen polymerase n=1 Tax=Rhodanobacter sp. Root179 TaxID=1736482 RepID=UPI0009EC9FBE|nr:O-antigen polymerase [Rhodanobacter sp. Root179]
MILFAFTLFTVFTIFAIYAHKNIMAINPVVGFLLFNWIMGCGAMLFLDLRIEADVSHCIVILISPLLLMSGSLLVTRTLGVRRNYVRFWGAPIVDEHVRVVRRAAILFLLCVLITLLYYSAVGYNLFVSTLSGGVSNFTDMRLEAYSGDKYFAPGYVNQFKNTMLPLLYFYFCFKLKGRNFGVTFIMFGLAFLLYALLGTGQRTFLVISFLMFIYCFIAYRGGSIPVRYLIVPLAIVLFLFSYISLQLGRSSGSGVVGGFGEVLHRVFESNQYSAVVGFRYVYEVEGVRYGAPWLQDFAGLLPGLRGDDISNKIFYILFGSYRGTSPLSIWGSVYYNFGMPGVIFFGALFGSVFQLSYLTLLKGPKTLFRLLCYSAIFLYFSIWVAGGPVQLINNGLFAVVLMLVMVKLTYKNERGVTAI